MKHRFVIARGPWRLLLKRLNIVGITMPWGTIYADPSVIDDPGFRTHELVHIEQMERDGRIIFSLRYLYWLARYGYRNNPYEKEAYNRGTPCQP